MSMISKAIHSELDHSGFNSIHTIHTLTHAHMLSVSLPLQKLINTQADKSVFH